MPCSFKVIYPYRKVSESESYNAPYFTVIGHNNPHDHQHLGFGDGMLDF